MKKLTSIVASLTFAAFALPASAASINGELVAVGEFAPTGGSGLLDDATGAAFALDGFVLAASGDLAPTGGGAIAFADFTFSPALDPDPVDPLFTAGDLTFTLTDVTVDFQSETQLDLTGSGIFSLPGFDDTAGLIVWTGNTAAGEVFTYSLSATTVPVPGALLLFASSLLGVGAVRRRA